MPNICIYEQRGRRRSTVICEAALAGMREIGERSDHAYEESYRGPIHDIAIFYGLSGNLSRIFQDYIRTRKKAVYIDLGYWHRRIDGGAGRFRGYHKISVNSRHPTAYFQKAKHDSSRADKLKLSLKPWREKGTHILVAGMGGKAAAYEGFRVCEWEQQAIATLRTVTDRPITFRPKPGCTQSQPINGTDFSPAEQNLADALADCHAVVTHHSNVAADALLAGVPVFSKFGVATPMGGNDIRTVESPIMTGDRQQWLNDAAYCQWNVEEISRGLPWLHLKSEGLI